MNGGFTKYRVVYKHLWQTYGSSWQVRLSFVLQIITRICKIILLPIALSLIITHLSTHDYPGARRAAVLFVVTSLAFGLLSPLVKYVGMLGENKIYRTSTAHYFSKLVSADLDYFNSNLSGYLTTATRQYVDSCVQFIRTSRERYITTVLSITLPLVVTFWLDPLIGVATLGLSLIQATYLLWASNVITPYRTKARELYKANSGRMADIISNILAVRSTAQEHTYVSKVADGASAESAAFQNRYTMQAKLVTIRELITVFFFMILLLLTVERMSSGHISLTAAILVVTYANTIMTGIFSLSDDLDEHDDYIDKIVPAFEILERKNVVDDPAKPVALGRVNGSIEFKHVSFGYHKEKSNLVFSSLDLTIPKGQRVGIVGLSGAGKSTLTKLLLRFNDVDAGEILIDSTNICDIKQTSLRRNIAYVPQEPLLFHTSVRDNVLLSRPSASTKEIEAALRSAHALNFVKQLRDGLDSIVGERGVKLSGGQKQRIAIARAVLQDAPIIVLDEATSALDSESEQIIKDSFADVLKGKTALVVAHRLSTLSEMDRIVVIEKGKLIEDGSHDELVAGDGVYARLWRRQQKQRLSEETSPF